jgi:subtilase family serine protease
MVLSVLPSKSLAGNVFARHSLKTLADPRELTEVFDAESIEKSIPITNFTMAQLIPLYQVPSVVPSENSRVVKIAIIIAFHYPEIQQDLDVFWKSEQNFGPSSQAPKINVYTFEGATVNNDWNMEECLDVQTIASLNPCAEIWIIEAKTNSVPDLVDAINYANNVVNADIVSMSIGVDDSEFISKFNYIFNNPNPNDPNNYKCFVSASGDTNNVAWPPISPSVVGVGGTSLMWRPTSANPFNRIEYTWDKAGSGYSQFVSKPYYQNNVNNTTQRCTPDVSMIANPKTGFFIYFKGTWTAVGGTSLSAPFFAGVLSIANQMRFNLNKAPLTSVYNENNIYPLNIQHIMYNIIYPNETLYKQCFTDIVKGIDGQFIAKPGYDIATGLGSPNAAKFCAFLSSL